jgi:hypothetical protein
MFRRILIGLAVAGALAFAAPAAFAGTDEQIVGSHGSVLFLHDGDRLEAYDTKGEGWSVKAELRWGVASHASAWDVRFDDFPDRTNLDLPEGITVQLRMCYYDNGYLINCSQWQHATA